MFFVTNSTENLILYCLQIGLVCLVPILVAVYYAAKSGYWPYPVESDFWERFLKLWSHESVIIPFMLVGMGLLFGKKELRDHAYIPMGVIFLYLIAPLICFLVNMGQTLKAPIKSFI